ncbi:CoA-transferase family III domain-containing protein [Lasiosphaeris hirsuta]|uniref:CoA-transferase family III domain-containing protein n=1 Tax=Lasiosphaeris hirsuta TaxID=260670 RepID=A0AA40AZP0_9PEZI|nr:CoA-transferase family III domain-containing protein [Lasiosphaeris hirsuta]
MATTEYSVPREAEKLLREGILENPLVTGDLPPGLAEMGMLVRYEGSRLPSIPVNWRWAESISALKGFEATMLNYLLTRKYGIPPIEVTINTDHASLFIMSPALARIVKQEKGAPFSMDVARPPESLHRILATGIYKARDNHFYHIHGSLNPDQTLTALSLPLEGPDDDTFERVIDRMQSRVSQFDAEALDEIMNEQYLQAGTVAWTSDEYFQSLHGQQSGKKGLYELVRDPSSSQPAGWWPECSSLPSSPKRPLAGLKVVDLTRVIAGPTITRSLAELGASIMRVTSPHLPDFKNVFHDLNWGKWNCSLHLKDDADKEQLRALILEADVVVDGYRPGVMDRLGFGREAIFDMVKNRGRGIIHLRENCYGWHGPWAHRSGWQGISDACTGVSLAYGRAMGVDEAVTPPFPNSDHCTGVIGCIGILHALAEKALHGGSYGVDVALNYYSQWLVRSCGTYSDDVWQQLWERHGSPVFRNYDNTRRTVPAMLELMHHYDEETMFDPSFFQECRSAVVGATVRKVRPVARFKDGAVDLSYNVGTRGNGVDKAVWPDNLTTDIVV